MTRFEPSRSPVNSRPLAIAHRGASGTCPENTLAAFRRAAELGADMIELDVQLTRDGEVVVIHDATLERTSDGRGAVCAHTRDQLRRLDAGAWFAPHFAGERIPTLGETLDAVSLAVNVELKAGGDDGLAAGALRIVRARSAEDRVVFSSFDLGLLEQLRNLAGDVALAVLWSTAAASDAVRWAERVGARALHLRKDAATPEMRAAAASAGLALRVWTVNDPEEMARFVTAGVDGVFTDYPERFLHIRACA